MPYRPLQCCAAFLYRVLLGVGTVDQSARQTIGMLIESMAGKSGALHGTFQVREHVFFPLALLLRLAVIGHLSGARVVCDPWAV